MFKVIVIYKNLEDVGSFQKFYTEEIFPRARKVPGIIGANITSIVQQISEEVPTHIDGLQFMMELHFETKDDISKVGDTAEGQELFRKIKEYTNSELLYLMGDGKVYDAKLQKLLLGNHIWENNKRE
jgi:uncharacterized protein (TIGR02118 family)